MILLCLFLSSVAQALLYWLAAKHHAIRWLDFVVFPVFIVANIWIFPALLSPAANENDECGFSSYGMSFHLLLFGGLSLTVLLFVLNCYLRKEKASS